MNGTSFIIRFPDEKSRTAFRNALEREDLKGARVRYGAHFPHVVVTEATPEVRRRIEHLAGSQASIFEDTGFDPMGDR